MRASSSGPMSETVARTGWPCSPYTSQNTVGQPAKAGASTPISFRRSSNLGDAAPAWLMPERSPLTSAMKTGTPSADRRSAMTCSVTVLPVPVAPVMSPWRLAQRGQQETLDVAVFGDQHGVGHGRSWTGGWGRHPSVASSAGRGAGRHGGVRLGPGRRPGGRWAPGLQKGSVFCYDFGLQTLELQKKWAGHSPFFFLRRTLTCETWRIARDDATPDGVRTGRLGDVSQGPARPRVHRQAGGGQCGRGFGSERRGLRQGQPPPDPPLHRREHRLRPARSVVAGPGPAADQARRLRAVRRRGRAAQPARADRRRAALERNIARRRGRSTSSSKPRPASGRSPSRRSTAAAWYPRSSGEKANEPRTAAPGGCPCARKERAQGDRFRRARIGVGLGDEKALPEPGNRRARLDRPRNRRLRVVPPLDGRARRGARGTGAPDRDHRRRRTRPRP